MAVKIKLTRLGKIRNPQYRIIVADARTRRNGRAIETIGKYHPKEEPSLIEVDSERAQYWLGVGAQPTEPVLNLLKITGDWQKFKGLPGAEGTLRKAEPKPTKLELFQDQVFCFTPRGRLIALPRGATPIDFAYALHTDIGDTCVGAKINGAILPLVTQLRSGDEVEIIRDQNHVPPMNWLGIAATGKARAAIRRSVRHAATQRALALGEHILNMMLEREGVMLDEAEDKALAEALGMATRRDLLIAVGEGKIGSEPLSAELIKVKGLRKRRRKLDLPVANTADGWFALRSTDLFRFRVPGGQRSGPRAKAALAQLDFHMPVTISGEGVVPGDRLVGILQPDAAMLVYPIHSDALIDMHDSDVAWVDVRWNLTGREDKLFSTVITMESVNKPGSLAQVSSAIAACDANINNLVMRMISPDFHQLIFEIEVRDLAQLTDVLATLKRSPGLSAVQRAGIREAGMISTLEWDGQVDKRFADDER